MLPTTNPSVEDRLVKSWIQRELALESVKPTVRTRHWREALKALRDDEKPADLRLTWHRGSIAVDVVQDRYSDMEGDDKVRCLNDALSQIERAKVAPLSDPELGQLLGRKASLLRVRATYTEKRVGDFAEPLKCAELAAKKNTEDLGLVLELGLSEWAYARHERTDAAYETRMRSAELHLKMALELEEGRFSLARFYRMNWRPIEACAAFPVIDPSGNWRRLLREAYILAEAVIDLETGETPVENYVEDRQRAMRLLERAIASGYDDARNIVDLAFLQYYDSNAKDADTILKDLMGGEAIDWNQIVDSLQTLSPSDLAAQGFALGIGDAASLNKLGTFAKDILRDEGKAERLYRLAMNVDRSNPIPVRNLADLLMGREDDEGAVEEAKGLILKAKGLSDRRFRRWVPVGE